MKTRKNATVIGSRAWTLRLAAEGFKLGSLALRGWTAAIGAALVASPAMAGPEGAQVVRGDVGITREGSTTIIRASDRAIINYRNFDIAGGETVRFVQPSANARVLNRIQSAAPTRIDGSLLANGRVYIVNPAGVFFGAGARVDVAGLVAAAGSMTDRDFLRGVDRFSALSGSVVNEGQLNATSVLLTGASVVNSGSINAPAGTIVMAAGRDVLVGERHGNIFVRVAGEAKPAEGQAAIENSGTANARGGRVTMLAGDVYSMAVRNSGTIRGRDVRVEGAGRGEVRVSGTIDASGAGNAQARGGDVRVLGEQVAILPGASIDASGPAGGGQVLVGGNYLGQGPERNATNTYVAPNTSINASATESGDGGRVIVWSDNHTGFYGQILANGRGQGKAGGFVETSGKETLDIRGATVLATGGEQGRGGVWLLDPRNVTIEQVGGGGSDNSSGTTGSPNYAANADNAVVDVDGIRIALAAGTSVEVRTGNTGTQDGNITWNDGPPAGDDDLNVVVGGSGATLTLRAANNIQINADINATGANALNLVLIANSGATGGNDDLNTAAGNVVLNGTIALNGGFLTSSGVNFTLASTGSIAAGGQVTLRHTGTVGISGGITTAAGMVIGDVGVAPGAITLNSAISLGGTFQITGMTAGVNQTGGSVIASGLAIDGVGAVVLEQAANSVDFLAAVTTGGNFSFRDADGLTVSNFAGGIYDRLQVGSANDISLNVGGLLFLSDIPIRATTGTVTLNSGLTISQGASGNIVATQLRVLADSANLATASTNDVATLAANVTNNLSYRDANAFSVGTVSVTNGITAGGDVALQSGGLITLAQSVSGANLVFNSTAGASQTGGTITGTTLALRGTGPFTLDSANAVGTIASNAAGVVSFTNGNTNLTVGTADGLNGITNGTVVSIVTDGALVVDQSVSGSTSILLASGRDASGNLSFGSGVTLTTQTLALQAGDNADNGAGGTLASIDLITNTPTFTLTGANVFSMRQDDGFGDANVAAASQFTNGVSGLTYNLKSDGSIARVDTGSKVAGSNLTLEGQTEVNIGGAISPNTLNILSNGSVGLGGDITATIISASAGRDGSGNLSAPSAIFLRSPSITLRAGNDTAATASVSVANITFQGTSSANNPTALTIRQDAAISGTSVPAAGAYGAGSAAGVTLTLQSDGGAVVIGAGQAGGVAGSALTLIGEGVAAIDIQADIAPASVSFVGATVLAANVNAGSGSVTFNNSMSALGGERVVTGGTVSLTGIGGGEVRFTNSGVLTLNAGTYTTATFRQDGAGAVGLLADVSSAGLIFFNSVVNGLSGNRVLSGTGIEIGGYTGTGSLTITNSGTFASNGAIGAASFTQNGAGTSTLGGNINTGSGAISFATSLSTTGGTRTLTGGTISLNGIGGGDITIVNSGTLTLAGTTTPGTFTQSGAGGVTLNTNINAGSSAISFAAAPNGGAGNRTLTGGAITIGGYTGTGGLTITNSGLFTSNGSIGAASFTQNGTGLSTLAGDINTGGGAINFATSVTGTGGNRTFTGGAITFTGLGAGTYTVTNSGTLTLGGTLTPTNLTQNGTGTNALNSNITATGNVSFGTSVGVGAGSRTITAANVTLGGATGIGSLDVSNSGLLTLISPAANAYSVALFRQTNAAGSIVLGSATTDFATATFAGTLTLGSSNRTINASTLIFNGITSTSGNLTLSPTTELTLLGPITMGTGNFTQSGAILNPISLQTNISAGNISFDGPLTIPTTARTLTGTAITLGGISAGSLVVTNSGLLTIVGATSPTNFTQNGTGNVNLNTTIGASGNVSFASVVNVGAATRGITGVDVTLNGATGSGTLQVNNSGILSLNGATAYTGLATFQQTNAAGTISVVPANISFGTGTVSFLGTLDLGSAGATTITAQNLTLAGITGTTTNLGLVTSGSLTLNGPVNLGLGGLSQTGTSATVTLNTDLTLGGALFQSPIVVSGGTRTITSGGGVTLVGLSGTGLIVDASDTVTLNAGNYANAAFTKRGSGNLAFNPTTTNFTGAFSLEGGVLQTGTGTFTLRAGSINLETGVLVGSGNTLTLRSNTITTPNANIFTGTGTLAVVPQTVTDSISINGSLQTLNLSNTFLNAIANGGPSLIVGSGANTINLGAGAYRSFTTFDAGSANSITVAGALTSPNNTGFTFTGPLALSADVNAGTGPVIFERLVTSTGSRTFTSGTIDFDGGLLASLATDSVTLANSGLARIRNNDFTVGGTITQTGTGGIRLERTLTGSSGITLVGEITLAGTGTRSILSSSGPISLAAVNGSNDLIVDAGLNAVTLGGTIGGTTPLASLQVIGLGISSQDVNVTGALTFTTAGTVDINGDLSATSTIDISGSNITFNGSASSGTVTVVASGNVNVNDDLTGTTISIRSGVDGTGNVLFGTGVDVSATTISLRAGDGTGGAGLLAFVDAATNSPTFRGASGGATSPTSFTLRQDADIDNPASPPARTPAASQFAGGIGGLDLTLQSDDGLVFINDASRVADTDLVLTSPGGVRILTSIAPRSLQINGSAQLDGGIIASGDVELNGSLLVLSGNLEISSGTGTIFVNQPINVGGNTLTLTGDEIAIDAALSGTGGNLILQPFTVGRNVRVGGTSAPANTLLISDAELALITPGFGSLAFGRTDGTALLDTGNTLSFADPVSFRMGGTGGRITTAHRVSGTDDGSLAFNVGGFITLGGDVDTEGDAITFNGPVFLAANDVRVRSNLNGAPGAAITFNGSIDDDTATPERNLIVDGGTGAIAFQGLIGTFDAVGSLTATGSSISLVGSRTSQGFQVNGPTSLFGQVRNLNAGDVTFNGPVILSADGLAIAAESGEVNFNGTVDSSSGTPRSLSVNGSLGITASNAIGGIEALDSISFTGPTITVSGVRTNANQTYKGTAVVNGPLRGANINFTAATVNAAITADDLVSFGSTAAFNAGSSINAGRASFSGAVTLNEDLTITATNTVNFSSTINSGTGLNKALTVNAATTTFGAGVGQVDALSSLSSSGATTVAADISTTGAQTYGGAFTLANDVVLASTGGRIEFAGAVNSDLTQARALTVNSGGNSDTVFGGGVGLVNALSSLTTNADGRSIFGGNVTTAGAIAINDAVVLNTNTTFTGVGVAFAGGIDSDSAVSLRNLTVDGGSGGVTLGSSIGQGDGLNQVRLAGQTMVVPGVRSAGSQTYNGELRLGGNLASTGSGAIAVNGNLRLSNAAVVTTAGASGDNVTITGTINGFNAPAAFSVVAGSGAVSFGGAVGLGSGAGDAAVSSVTVSGGTIALSSVRTAGAQSFTGATTLTGDLTTTAAGNIAVNGALTLGANTIINTNSGSVLLGGVVDSDTTSRSLVVTAGGTGNARFGGAVGSARPLSTLTISTPGGKAIIAAASMATTGDTIFNHAVGLEVDSTLAANDVVFTGALDSEGGTARSLTVNTTTAGADLGELTFAQGVGQTNPLRRIVKNDQGTTLAAANIRTTEGFTIGSPMLIGGPNVTLDGGAGTLWFRSTLQAADSVTDPTLTLLSTLAADRTSQPFRFGSNVGGAVGGSGRFGAVNLGANLTAPAQAATAIFTDAFNADGRILAANVAAGDTFTIRTGTGGFTMGEGQKITAFGTLRIISEGIVTLGDLTALTNIEVSGTAIRVRLRPDGNVLTNQGALQRDLGVDFVTGGLINFNRVPESLGTGLPEFTFSNNNPAQRSPQLQGFVFRQFPGGVSAALFSDPSNAGQLLGLDLAGQGPSVTNTATSIAGAIPRDAQTAESTAPTVLGEDLKAELIEMGVRPRDLGFEETLSFLVGRSLYQDLPLKANPSVRAGDFQVTVNRLNRETVLAAVEAYRDLRYQVETGPDGQPVLDESGRPKRIERFADIQDTIGASWDRYAETVSEPTGEGYRAWLESLGDAAQPEDTQALANLRQISEVLGRIESLGLAPFETQIAQRKVLGDTRPNQMTEAQFRSAVSGQAPESPAGREEALDAVEGPVALAR